MKTTLTFVYSFAAIAFTIALHGAATAAETVQFTLRPPQVGQQASHELKFQLDLNITLRQAGQTVSSDEQQLNRTQERSIAIAQVADDRAVKVHVQFPKARESVVRAKKSSPPQPQPIEGKSYLVERRGEELVVTDPQGQIVPEPERVLVAASMEAVGRHSPLGKFLHGKKVAVGQSLTLPNAMATDVLGMKETGGEAQKVELKLRSVRQEAERKVAEFDMLIVMKLSGGATMDIKGDMRLDPDTCQIAAANFSGPVSMREEHGPKGHTFEVISHGTMNVAVRSRELK